MHAAAVGLRCALALAGLWPASAGAQRGGLADFARPDAGARVTALAGAAVAAPAGAVTATWNPAALAGATRGEFSFEHRGAGPGLTLESASLTLAATRRLDVAMRAHVLRRDGIAAAEAVGGARGTPTLSGYLGGLQAALDVGRGVHVGAGCGRVAGFPVGNDRPSAWSVDVGVHAQRRAMRAGVAARGLLFGTRSADASASAGSWSAGLETAVPRTRLALAMQVDGTDTRDISGSTGLCCRAAHAVELRAGARLRAGEAPVFGAGAAFGAGEARLEYAARIETGAGTQHVITARVGFGGVPAARPTPRLPRSSSTATPREDTAPRVPAAVPAPKPATPSVPVVPPTTVAPTGDARFSVIAGPYPSLEVAARDAFRLRNAGLHPTVEHRGKQVVLVLQQGASEAQAHALGAQARAAKVVTRIEAE